MYSGFEFSQSKPLSFEMLTAGVIKKNSRKADRGDTHELK
jgi:hypothetical protein